MKLIVVEHVAPSSPRIIAKAFEFSTRLIPKIYETIRNTIVNI